MRTVWGPATRPKLSSFAAPRASTNFIAARRPAAANASRQLAACDVFAFFLGPVLAAAAFADVSWKERKRKEWERRFAEINEQLEVLRAREIAVWTRIQHHSVRHGVLQHRRLYSTAVASTLPDHHEVPSDRVNFLFDNIQPPEDEPRWNQNTPHVRRLEVDQKGPESLGDLPITSPLLRYEKLLALRLALRMLLHICTGSDDLRVRHLRSQRPDVSAAEIGGVVIRLQAVTDELDKIDPRHALLRRKKVFRHDAPESEVAYNLWRVELHELSQLLREQMINIPTLVDRLSKLLLPLDQKPPPPEFYARVSMLLSSNNLPELAKYSISALKATSYVLSDDDICLMLNHSSHARDYKAYDWIIHNLTDTNGVLASESSRWKWIRLSGVLLPMPRDRHGPLMRGLIRASLNFNDPRTAEAYAEVAWIRATPTMGFAIKAFLQYYAKVGDWEGGKKWLQQAQWWVNTTRDGTHPALRAVLVRVFEFLIAFRLNLEFQTLLSMVAGAGVEPPVLDQRLRESSERLSHVVECWRVEFNSRHSFAPRIPRLKPVTTAFGDLITRLSTEDSSPLHSKESVAAQDPQNTTADSAAEAGFNADPTPNECAPDLEIVASQASPQAAENRANSTVVPETIAAESSMLFTPHLPSEAAVEVGSDAADGELDTVRGPESFPLQCPTPSETIQRAEAPADQPISHSGSTKEHVFTPASQDEQPAIEQTMMVDQSDTGQLMEAASIQRHESDDPLKQQQLVIEAQQRKLDDLEGTLADLKAFVEANVKDQQEAAMIHKEQALQLQKQADSIRLLEREVQNWRGMQATSSAAPPPYLDDDGVTAHLRHYLTNAFLYTQSALTVSEIVSWADLAKNERLPKIPTESSARSSARSNARRKMMLFILGHVQSGRLSAEILLREAEAAKARAETFKARETESRKARFMVAQEKDDKLHDTDADAIGWNDGSDVLLANAAGEDDHAERLDVRHGVATEEDNKSQDTIVDIFGWNNDSDVRLTDAAGGETHAEILEAKERNLVEAKNDVATEQDDESQDTAVDIFGWNNGSDVQVTDAAGGDTHATTLKVKERNLAEARNDVATEKDDKSQDPDADAFGWNSGWKVLLTEVADAGARTETIKARRRTSNEARRSLTVEMDETQQITGPYSFEETTCGPLSVPSATTLGPSLSSSGRPSGTNPATLRTGPPRRNYSSTCRPQDQYLKAESTGKENRLEHRVVRKVAGTPTFRKTYLNFDDGVGQHKRGSRQSDLAPHIRKVIPTIVRECESSIQNRALRLSRSASGEISIDNPGDGPYDDPSQHRTVYNHRHMLRKIERPHVPRPRQIGDPQGIPNVRRGRPKRLRDKYPEARDTAVFRANEHLRFYESVEKPGGRRESQGEVDALGWWDPGILEWN